MCSINYGLKPRMYTAISTKVVIVSSQFWNQKKLMVQSYMRDPITRQRRLLLYGPALYIFSRSMLTVINCLCCLNPKVPFGSSIDY